MLTDFKHGPSKCQRNGLWQRLRHSAAILGFSESRWRLKNDILLSTLCCWNYFGGRRNVLFWGRLWDVDWNRQARRGMRVTAWESWMSQATLRKKTLKKIFFHHEYFRHSQIFRPRSLITQSLSRIIMKRCKTTYDLVAFTSVPCPSSSASRPITIWWHLV